jgi:CRP/FNR family cyclic AMP-dependent transcriptional regulator
LVRHFVAADIESMALHRAISFTGDAMVISPEILEGFTFFAGLSQTHLRSLSIIANPASFERGDLIFREDEPAHTLYLLLDGWVDIMINTDVQGARQALVTTRISGDVFGWSAVVEPCIYTASAMCVSPVKVIGFRGADLLALFEIDAQLCRLMMKRICQVVANRLQATRLQMVSLFMAH